MDGEHEGLRVERVGETWVLVGDGFDGVEFVNEFLGYLVDRNYAPLTVRAYAYDLLQLRAVDDFRATRRRSGEHRSPAALPAGVSYAGAGRSARRQRVLDPRWTQRGLRAADRQPAAGGVYRVLYRRSGNLFVLLHIIEKRSRAIPAGDIKIAKDRWTDFKARMDADERRPPRAAGRDAP